MGFATSGCVLIAIVFSLQARTSAGEPPRKLLRIVLAAVLAVTGATYLILFERFTFELPTTGGRIVVGCGFTSEAADVAAKSLIDTAGDCPGHYEELLEKAQYEAHFIWTKRSIAAVRLALAGLWSVWFACFTGLALAVIARARRPAPVRRRTSAPGESFDVFVSYAREDRERVEVLVSALEAEGFRVWWDLELTPGQTWDSVLEERLASARSVVVVWSFVSVEKHWVREEARKALERGVLVPVRIDAVEPPLGFSYCHAASLVDWSGSRNDGQFRSVVSAVGSLVGVKRGR